MKKATAKKAAPAKRPASKAKATKPTAKQKAAIKRAPFKGGSIAAEAPEEDPASKPMPKGFKIPKTLAECGDLLYTTRERRLAMGKELELLENAEGLLRKKIIDELPMSKAGGITGRVAAVKIEKKEYPTVKDWKKVHAYIKRTGSFDLLQRKLSDAAVKARWENKQAIPGVEKFTKKTLSVTKV